MSGELFALEKPGLLDKRRLAPIFYVAPRLAEAFRELREHRPSTLERDPVVEAVCALYLERPALWKGGIELPAKPNRTAINSMWRLERGVEEDDWPPSSTRPSVWRHLRRAWLCLTGHDLAASLEPQLRFRRKSHRLFAEGVTRCLVCLSVGHP